MRSFPFALPLSGAVVTIFTAIFSQQAFAQALTGNGFNTISNGVAYDVYSIDKVSGGVTKITTTPFLSGSALQEVSAGPGTIWYGLSSGENFQYDWENDIWTSTPNGIGLFAEGVFLPSSGGGNSSAATQTTDNAKGVATNSKAILNNSSAILSNRKAIDSVQDNVNDLGFGVAGATALSTAMSALPTVAQDSPISCGVGTGGYSSRFAMSVGCAVKASSRLAINAGGSYVFGGGADYGNGSLSSAAARAGFVFKLGNLQQPEGGNNEQLQSQLNEVKEENASIKSQNQTIQSENASIRSQNQELLARLERLEAIALGNQSSTTSVSLK